FVSVASGHLTLLAVGQVLQRSLEPAQVTGAKGGGNHMCSNPDTFEFRLSLDLPQQSAVPTDTFSALRKIHEYSAENGPRFHTAAEMFDSLGI
ncbi:hypothetical protein GBB33_10220, partial [Bifidobacterium longum]